MYMDYELSDDAMAQLPSQEELERHIAELLARAEENDGGSVAGSGR